MPFITFEGIEGAGKTEQARRLVSMLHGFLGRNAVLTKEPGADTAVGRGVRELLLTPRNTILYPDAEFFLFLADRAQHVREIVQPALKRGDWVVSDRYIGSTFAYQLVARDMDNRDARMQAINLATGGLMPDLQIVLLVEPEVGIRRVHGRGEKMDRFEREELAFHRRVHEGFREWISVSPNCSAVVDDGTKSIEEIHHEIFSRVVRKFSPHYAA
ncbi:MAG: dTMP kinase [Candidatus Paceibacterota bacterium]|nr:MAG: dTMP kinase [Candidatus Paceibacterota bacterium]